MKFILFRRGSVKNNYGFIDSYLSLVRTCVEGLCVEGCSFILSQIRLKGKSAQKKSAQGKIETKVSPLGPNFVRHMPQFCVSNKKRDEEKVTLLRADSALCRFLKQALSTLESTKS